MHPRNRDGFCTFSCRQTLPRHIYSCSSPPLLNKVSLSAPAKLTFLYVQVLLFFLFEGAGQGAVFHAATRRVRKGGERDRERGEGGGRYQLGTSEVRRFLCWCSKVTNTPQGNKTNTRMVIVRQLAEKKKNRFDSST